MRVALILLTLLLPFMSPAMAGGPDGKGLYCPTMLDPKVSSCSYWFKNGKYICYYFDRTEIVSTDAAPYGHDLSRIWVAQGVIDRETLVVHRTVDGDDSYHQCRLVNSLEELRKRMGELADELAAKNKI